MSVTLVFLALLLSVVVWWLIKQTVNVKPWISGTSGLAVRDDGVRSPLSLMPFPSEKLGLGVFLAVVTSLFALFISAYSIRMEYADWRPLVEPPSLWINTGILFASSVCLQLAWNATRRLEAGAVRVWIAGAAVFACLFIVGQLMVWNQLTAGGYLLQSNPANAFFYLLTGMHVLHLSGGLVALVKSIRRAWDSESTRESVTLGVELCAVYWHFLFVVWLILFGLMLTT